MYDVESHTYVATTVTVLLGREYYVYSESSGNAGVVKELNTRISMPVM